MWHTKAMTVLSCALQEHKLAFIFSYISKKGPYKCMYWVHNREPEISRLNWGYALYIWCHIEGAFSRKIKNQKCYFKSPLRSVSVEYISITLRTYSTDPDPQIFDQLKIFLYIYLLCSTALNSYHWCCISRSSCDFRPKCELIEDNYVSELSLVEGQV